ncbi:MAG: hypothetical protein H0V82_01585 [Candidatus Protochlamydia sp.]|nr:hypothetical protein [Candidatus Protochlamydia sp.]
MISLAEQNDNSWLYQPSFEIEKKSVGENSNKKNLKRIFSKLNPFDAKAISKLPHDLEKLVIKRSAWKLDNDDIENFTSRIKRLKSLHIEGTEIDLPAKSLYPILKANQQITKLLANDSNIDGYSLKIIPHKMIETISLSYCELLNSSELIDFLKNNPQLKNLQLSHTLITKEVAIAIAKYCSQLEVLELSNSAEIEEGDFIKLAHQCSQLKEIHVSSATAFSDRVLIEFLQSCPGLNKIDARYTEISDLALKEISGLKRPIKMLCINGCEKISCDGVEEVLKASHETLEILRFHSQKINERIITLLEIYRPPLIEFNLTSMHYHFEGMLIPGSPKAAVLLNIIEILSKPISRIKDMTISNFAEINYDTLLELKKICQTVERIQLSSEQLMKMAGSNKNISTFCEKFEKEFKIKLNYY